MKYSIITCTLNSAEFLRKNIDSVKSQTHKNYEHIFIDGFSTDATLEIIKQYQLEYPDKVSLHQIKPQGISNAMNAGINLVTGDYLIHLHSDDSFYNEDVLTKTDSLLSNNTYDWVYGKINVIDRQYNNLGVFPIKSIWQNKGHDSLKKYLLNFYNYIPHQAVFIKKSVFDRLGYFDEKLTSGMDFDLWLRIFKNTKWSFLNVIVSNYMIREGSQSSDNRKKMENINNLLIVQKRHLNIFELYISKIFNIILSIKNKNYK